MSPTFMMFFSLYLLRNNFRADYLKFASKTALKTLCPPDDDSVDEEAGGGGQEFPPTLGDHLKLHLDAVFPFFFFPGRLPENGTTLVAVLSVFLPPSPSDVMNKTGYQGYCNRTEHSSSCLSVWIRRRRMSSPKLTLRAAAVQQGKV